MNEEPIVFRCEADELIGILHHGDGVRRDVGILIVVGGPQYRVGSHRQFVMMARALAAEGFAVFRFDYRGMGDSSGEQRTFESVHDDICAATDVLTERVPALRHVAVLGLCDAASAALMYAYRDSRIDHLILINPWVRSHALQAKAVVRHYYAERVFQREFWSKLLTGELNIVSSGRAFLASLHQSLRREPSGGRQSDSFVEKMQRGLEGFRGNVLLLLSEDDLTAREFESLCSSSPRWRQLISNPSVASRSVAGADHTFSSKASLSAAVGMVIGWLAARGRP